MELVLLYHVAIWTIVHKVFFSHSATHSFMHICIHLFLSLCVIPPAICHSMHSFMHACKHSFSQAFIHFSVHLILIVFFLFQSLIVYSPIIAFHSLVHSWVHPSICPPIHSFNLSFMHSCIHHAFRHLGVSPFSSFLVLFHFGLFIQSLVSFYWCPFIVCGFGSGLNARLRPDQVTNSTVNWIKLTNSMMNDIIDWFVESLEPCWCFKAATQPSSSLCQLNHLTLSTSQDSLVSWCAHNLIWLWLGWVWCSLPCGIHVHKMTLRLIETHSILQLNQAGIMMLMLIFCYELDKIHLSLMQTCAYKQSQTK